METCPYPFLTLIPATSTIYLNAGWMIILSCNYSIAAPHDILLKNDHREFKDVGGKTHAGENIHETPTSAVCHFPVSALIISVLNCPWASVWENTLAVMEEGAPLTRKPSKNQAGSAWSTRLSVSTSVLACWGPGLVLRICPWAPSPTLLRPDCSLCTLSPSLSSRLLSCLAPIDRHIE